ncbi:hypothetical protein P3T76_015621 [Phytophthora citrophthora]|uniref:SWIM-type domain-containing protein n=1 Tax=Phytophthora citrophthora TaxID=4793 RepID=A0AAD9FYW5_9STRA|nr:hypothetical protein P3T76_015621 [Phytophthora citrophthora]
MSSIADLFGNESDVTVLLEYSDSTSDSNISAPPHSSNEDSDSDECSLDFGNDSGDTSDHAIVATEKSIYTSSGYYTTQTEAEQSIHGLNRFVYTYQTRYLSPFVLGKVYQCRSHFGCDHRIKLAIHRANENSFRYQLLQRGQHCGCIARRPARVISPVLKSEIDVLLRLGMADGKHICLRKDYTNGFFDVEVPVRSANIDHSDAIASALEIVWPEVEILTCWEHLLRHSRNQSKLATSNNFIKDHLQPHLRMLRFTHAEAVPSSIKACIEGVERFERADWLQSVYLYPRWERWSVGSSSIPGFLSTQQPIESHHHVIKVVVTDYKKALMVSVLYSVLPRVLLYDATNLSSGSQCHYAEGPLPLAAVMMAKDFLIDPRNHRVVNAKATQRPVRIFFNSTTSMVHAKNLAGTTVSAARTEKFQRSLRGWMGDEVPIDEIQAIFLSLHQVTVNDGLLAEMESLPIRSKWLFAEIRSIRSTLSCTCKRHMRSGWVCAHIIASLHLLKKLDIERALDSIPMRGLPGRPRRPFTGASLPSSLQRDGSTDAYDVDRLINLFTKEPGRPLKWPIIEEFDVVDGGTTVPDHQVGQVAACRLSPQDGVYVWTATLVDGDSAEHKVEELVHAIRRARDMK